MQNKTITFLLVILVILSFTQLLEAQWVRTNGPYGGKDVVGFGWDETRFYTGTTTGLYASTDNGRTWTRIGPDDPYTAIYAATGVGTTIVAGTHGSGIYRSTNNGTTWAVQGWPIGWVNSLIALYSPTTGVNIVAASRSGIYVSVDTGRSWTGPCAGIPPATEATSFAVTSSSLFAGTANGVYRSTDGGLNWTPAGLSGTALNSIAVVASPVGAAGKIVAASGSAIYLSADDGATWTRISAGLPSGTIGSIAAAGSKIVTICNGSIYNTTNDGATWSAANTGGLYFPAQTLFSNGAILLAGATRSGLFISTDLGDTWAPSNSGLGYARAEAMIAVETVLYAATKNSGVFISTDNGSTWFPWSAGLTSNEFYALCTAQNATGGTNLLTGGPSGVYVSSDLGMHWSKSNDGLTSTSILALTSLGSNIFAAVTNNGVWRSTNDGASWEQVINGMTSAMMNDFTILGATLYAGGAGVFRSPDFGQNWTETNPAFSTTTTKCLVANGGGLFAGTNAGVFSSFDQGSQWTPASGGLPNLTVNNLAAGENGLYAGTQAGVFLSANSGVSWSDVTTGLGYPAVYSMLVASGYLFVGTDSGIWRRPLAEMVTDIDNSDLTVPSEFKLEQNHPNPFNPETTIRYRLAAAARVRLAVYDVLGREVAVVVDERQSAGDHKAFFGSSRLPSGVYFYTLQAGGHTMTKKMIVLK